MAEKDTTKSRAKKKTSTKRSSSSASGAKKVSNLVDDGKTISEKIKDILKNQRAYSEVLDPLIEQYEQTVTISRSAYNSILEHGAVIEEKSREGDFRLKQNPAVQMYAALVKEARQLLRDIGMTVKDMNKTDNDQVEELINVINGIS